MGVPAPSLILCESIPAVATRCRGKRAGKRQPLNECAARQTMRQNVTSTVSGPDFRLAEADASLAHDLELVAKRLADMTRKATRDRDLDAALAAASAEQERRAREAAEKTAVALDSVAQWVERTEGRLSDTARVAPGAQEGRPAC